MKKVLLSIMVIVGAFAIDGIASAKTQYVCEPLPGTAGGAVRCLKETVCECPVGYLAVGVTAPGAITVPGTASSQG